MKRGDNQHTPNGVAISDAATLLNIGSRTIIIAKLGELLPAKSRKETGRGKKNSTIDCESSSLHPNTLSAYRKVAKLREEGKYK